MSSSQDVTEATGAEEEQSYDELQKQLHAMSYEELTLLMTVQPMGFESARLVRRLLNDLVAATAARKATERTVEKDESDVLEISQILLPLRRENAQLGWETHSEKQVSQLQEQVECALTRAMDMKEAQQDSERQLQVTRSSQEQLAALTTEHAKLQELCNQLNEKLTKREEEISRLSNLSGQAVNDEELSKRLQDLEERCQASSKQDVPGMQVKQLTTRVDILNDQVAKYESRLEHAAEQIRRNNDIAEKLQCVCILLLYFCSISEADRTNFVRRQAELDREYALMELRALQTKYGALEEEHLHYKESNHKSEGLPDRRLVESINSSRAAEERTDAFEEQLHTLTAHKDRLEDALRAMHYDKMSYTNALTNANSHNRVLTSDVARAEAKVKELSAEKVKLEQLLEEARTLIDAHTRELDVLRETLKQSEDSRTRDNENNASLHRELRSMDQLLSQRDTECQSLNQAVLIQKREVERLTAMLERLEATTGTESDDGDKKVLYAQKMKWLEEERQGLSREKEELMFQVASLKEELRKAKVSLREAELEKNKAVENEKLASKTQSTLESMLESKKREATSLQSELAESKEKIRVLTDRQNEMQVLLRRADEIENEKLVVQKEALALKRHLEELRDQNTSLKNRVESEGAHAKTLSNQIQKVQAEAALTSKKCQSLEKEKAELQTNYENAMMELRNVRQTCKHYQSEFEKLSNEVQAQQHSLSSRQDALQSSQTSISDLKCQVQQLQSELKLRQNNSHHLETRLEQEKTSHKSVQTQLVLLQDELMQAKETNRARDIAVKQLRAEIQVKDRALTEKTEALENLKLLLEQMESSRDQLVYQTKQRQLQTQRHEQEIDDLNAKVSSLESDISAKNTEIMSLKQLTRRLDSEKDDVSDQLDAFTEKYHEIEKEKNELCKTLQLKQSEVTDLQEQMGNVVNKLNESEDKLSKLQTHCAQLENELDRLEHLKGVHTAELTALAQDLENMTVENQAISEECTRLQQQERSHSQSTKLVKQSIREVERERDTLQIELEDLRHTYRSLVQEHEGTQKARAEISALQEELAIANESLRKQVTTLENQLQTLREKNVVLTTEAATYRDQVFLLTEKLEESVTKRNDLQTRIQHLVQELDTQKQVSTEISAQRYGAQAENAAVSQRIVHLEAKLCNSKYEIKSLQDKLHDAQVERQRLEEVASTLRQKVATNENMIEHLVEQRNAMAREIQASHQRLVPSSTATMNMYDLNHSPSSDSQVSRQDVPGTQSSPPPLRAPPSNAVGSTPESDGKVSSTTSFLPLQALEKAQAKCQELEDRLAQQDNTIKVRTFASVW
ncbi:hypothetical protein PsorP6_007727 [Peronosclerospora sorghi]|uniref:Uncharacterized protein n=1 Tax=Peronosclerospora sorghi TaxID=230839 RepID=A0ACC0WAS6_9STRA|nr:hypothetical protein PsorP6_007727 [Peronosclerospora sorghi]